MKAIENVIKNAIDSGKIVGASVLVMKEGQTIFERHAGWANRDRQTAVTSQTIFRLASMTKPIATAAALALVEQGVLSLDALITDWLPDFKPRLADGTPGQITLRHLLTHTSGLSYGFLMSNHEPYRSAGISDGIDETVLSLEENLARLATVPLLFTPGTNWCYSLSTDVLGAVLVKATGNTVPEIIAETVTRPLGMHDTVFYLANIDRVARAYKDDGDTPRLMALHDSVPLPELGDIYYAPCRIVNRDAYPSAGAGMAGTARDYALFLEAIRTSGKPILGKQSIALMTQDAVPTFDISVAGPGVGFGMGFSVIRDSVLANTPRHVGSFGWGGVYGGQMFVDPAESLTVVILTNTALEGCYAFADAITQAVYR